MKRIFCRYQNIVLLLYIFCLGAFPHSLIAQQTFNPDAQFVAPKKTKHRVEKQAEVESPVELDGILVNASRAKKPFSSINLLAPASDGYGENTVSMSDDSDTLGKPQGFILFGIQW